MSKITVASGIDGSVVSQNTLDILSAAGDDSKNPAIKITSTIRLPQRQAQIMYNNLENGNDIRYAAPGREVVAIYHKGKAEKWGRDKTIGTMTQRIMDLSENGKRVSKHCVRPEDYAKLNIVDIATGIPNPRDFVKALMKSPYVNKVITPFTSDYNDGRVSVDKNEPAIHVEIKQ